MAGAKCGRVVPIEVPGFLLSSVVCRFWRRSLFSVHFLVVDSDAVASHTVPCFEGHAFLHALGDAQRASRRRFISEIRQCVCDERSSRPWQCHPHLAAAHETASDRDLTRRVLPGDGEAGSSYDSSRRQIRVHCTISSALMD